MSSVSVFVGLDYHQDSVQVCVMDALGRVLLNRPCGNDGPKIAMLVQMAVKQLNAPAGERVFAAIEACSGAADLAEELIEKAGWSIDLAHSGYVAKIKQSPDKTDFSDARLLADLERVGYVPKVWLPPQQLRDLRVAVRYRQQLAAERRNVKLRVAALLRENRIETSGRRWTKAWVEWLKTATCFREQIRWVLDRHLRRLEQLNEDIKEAEARLEHLLKDDEVVKKLRSLKGVGLVTAAMLRAEIGRFDRFRTGKQLSRYCGLSPRNASSGTRQADAGLIKAGNPELRAVLIQTAHLLKRHDPRWSQLAGKMRAKGKPGSVIAAAVANRWVRWLFHQMKDLAA